MTAKRKKPSGQRQNSGAADNHRKASIVSHAATLGVCSAAKEYGVDRKTVQRYKAEHESRKNPELSRLVAQETEISRERSRSKIQRALDALLDRVIELAPSANMPDVILGVEKVGDLATARTVLGVEGNTESQEASSVEGLGRPSQGAATSGAVAPVH